MRHLICDTIAPPFGSYSHAVEIPPGARILTLAGQVGCTAAGHVPDDAGAQTELIFANLAAVLAGAGMGLSDLVKLTFYVASAEDLPAIREARDRILKSPFPALSLVIVAALGRPSWRLEVDGVAARLDI